MEILNSQKDQLFDNIVKMGLSPSMFELSKSEVLDNVGKSQIITVIKFRNSDFYFNFDFDFDIINFKSVYYPGDDSPKGFAIDRSWSERLTTFSKWLNNLKREIETPNKWADLEKFFYTIKDTDDETLPFNNEEKEYIRSKLESAKEELSKINGIEDKLSEINSRIDHLVEMVEKLNKFDWRALFMGTVFNGVISLALPEGVVDSVKGVFSSFFDGGSGRLM